MMNYSHIQLILEYNFKTLKIIFFWGAFRGLRYIGSTKSFNTEILKF